MIQPRQSLKHTAPPTESTPFSEAFPASTKVYVEGPHGIRVPMREIALAGGEPPLRVYDSSGPRDVDVREGLPRHRQPWIVERGVERTSGGFASALIPETLKGCGTAAVAP